MGTDKKELHYKGHLKIHAEDRPGIYDIASVFTRSNLNIVNIQSRDIDSMIIEFVVEVEVLNANSLNRIDGKITLIKIRYKLLKELVNDTKLKMKKSIFTNNAPAAPNWALFTSNSMGGYGFISGQIPLIPASAELNNKTFNDQASQVIDNLEAICKEVGGNLNNILKLT